MHWREIQKNNIRSSRELADFLALSSEQEGLLDFDPAFPLNVPRRIAGKMERGRIDDPLFLQFAPLLQEKTEVAGFVGDPVGDLAARCTSKLLQKYRQRALLVTTGACAMNCRFCFRREFPYREAVPGFEEELAHIAQESSLEEIILSGGDPLSLSNERLGEIITALDGIPHLKRLRFHTRFPLGIPERIDEGFLALLQRTRLQVWFILHCNHPRELDPDVLGALKQIQRLGIPILNQSVLLRRVNDSFSTLYALCSKLVAAGILPYYLHQLDPVSGASHFEVPEQEGIALIAQLQEALSGYAVPKFVKEETGHPSKTILT